MLGAGVECAGGHGRWIESYRFHDREKHTPDEMVGFQNVLYCEVGALWNTRAAAPAPSDGLREALWWAEECIAKMKQGRDTGEDTSYILATLDDYKPRYAALAQPSTPERIVLSGSEAEDAAYKICELLNCEYDEAAQLVLPIIQQAMDAAAATERELTDKLVEALRDSNSLYAAMYHEKRPWAEIEKQINDNNDALALVAKTRSNEKGE